MEKQQPGVSKNKGFRYPPILPIVFYDGGENWTAAVLMLTNLHKMSDFARIENEVSPEYLQKVLKDAPEYLLTIVTQVTGALLGEINVPNEEIEKFSEQIKERHMGKLFADFEPYDVQATRKAAWEEGIKEGRTEGLVTVVKQLGGTMETAIQQLISLYGLNEEEAQEKVKLYW